VLNTSAQVAIVIVGMVAVFSVLSLGQVILVPLSLAVVIGMMFGPLADFLERRGIRPALSAGLVVLLLLAVIFFSATLFVGPLSEWIQRGPLLWQKLQAQLAGLKQPLESLSTIQEQLKSVMGGDAALTVEVQDGGPVTNIAMLAPSLLADVLLFLAGLYFFLATRHNLRFSILSLFFSRRLRWRAAHVFRDVETKVSKFLATAALINLGVGVSTAAATFAIGLPSPLLWGGLAFLMQFIPYVGQAVMFVILFAVGLGTQSSLVGILLPVVAYAVINLVADQVVFPHLVGRALTLNPFIIFISIAFWLWLWGPVGGFLAVPSLLVVQSLMQSVFPFTAKLPEIVHQKVEAMHAAEAAAAEAAAAEARAEAEAKAAARAEAKAEKAEAKAEAVEARLTERETTEPPTKPAAKPRPRRKPAVPASP
jgi:predicted PurR-regulated permease PerM